MNNGRVLPGDVGVLLLQQVSAKATWHTIAGGDYFVRHGAVTGQSSEYYHLSGERIEGFVAPLVTIDGNGR